MQSNRWFVVHSNHGLSLSSEHCHSLTLAHKLWYQIKGGRTMYCMPACVFGGHSDYKLNNQIIIIQKELQIGLELEEDLRYRRQWVHFSPFHNIAAAIKISLVGILEFWSVFSIPKHILMGSFLRVLRVLRVLRFFNSKTFWTVLMLKLCNIFLISPPSGFATPIPWYRRIKYSYILQPMEEESSLVWGQGKFEFRQRGVGTLQNRTVAQPTFTSVILELHYNNNK